MLNSMKKYYQKYTEGAVLQQILTEIQDILLFNLKKCHLDYIEEHIWLKKLFCIGFKTLN